MSKHPTDKQLAVRDALRRLIKNDVKTTFANLAVEAKCCQTYAYQAIISLEKKGYIIRIPRKHGALTVVEGI